jgi:structural maintenance of chromosomes protein 6
MVKRRTDSESEDDSPSMGAKRARTIDSDEGEDDDNFEILSSLQNKTKGKGKARNVTFDEEGGADGDDLEAEDNRFEEAHRETILAGLEEKRKVHGVRHFFGVLFFYI